MSPLTFPDILGSEADAAPSYLQQTLHRASVIIDELCCDQRPYTLVLYVSNYIYIVGNLLIFVKQIYAFAD